MEELRDDIVENMKVWQVEVGEGWKDGCHKETDETGTKMEENKEGDRH